LKIKKQKLNNENEKTLKRVFSFGLKEDVHEKGRENDSPLLFYVNGRQNCGKRTFSMGQGIQKYNHE